MSPVMMEDFYCKTPDDEKMRLFAARILAWSLTAEEGSIVPEQVPTYKLIEAKIWRRGLLIEAFKLVAGGEKPFFDPRLDTICIYHHHEATAGCPASGIHIAMFDKDRELSAAASKVALGHVSNIESDVEMEKLGASVSEKASRNVPKKDRADKSKKLGAAVSEEVSKDVSKREHAVNSQK